MPPPAPSASDQRRRGDEVGGATRATGGATDGAGPSVGDIVMFKPMQSKGDTVVKDVHLDLSTSPSYSLAYDIPNSSSSSHARWTKWLGYNPGRMTLSDAMDDWDHGVKVASQIPATVQPEAALHGDRSRIAPLRFLEMAHTTIKELWRAGETRKTVNLVKRVVFAVHRRVYGLPRSQDEAGAQVPPEHVGKSLSLGDACQMVENMAPKCAKGISWAANHGLSSEWSPDAYEAYLSNTNKELLSTLQSHSSSWAPRT